MIPMKNSNGVIMRIVSRMVMIPKLAKRLQLNMQMKMRLMKFKMRKLQLIVKVRFCLIVVMTLRLNLKLMWKIRLPQELKDI